MIPTLLSRIQGCMMGVIIGDAMGMPVELMKAEEIFEQTGGLGVTGFIHPIQHRIKGTAGLAAGTPTDDWQLTKVIADSLCECREFDLTDIALRHVDAYERSTFGWGRNTKGAMEEMQAYFGSRGREGRRPLEARDIRINSGCGNGVAMKIAPVAFYQYRARQSLHNNMKQIMAVGRLTHADTRAWTAAFVLSSVIENIFDREVIVVDDQRETWLLNKIQSNARMFEDICARTSGPKFEDKISNRLVRLRDRALLHGPIDKLIKEVGNGVNAMESVPFAIALYLRNPTDFRTAVLEAVNAGGDADSTASMVGAMIGATVGLEKIPDEWKEFNPAFEDSIKTANKLIETKFYSDHGF